MTFIKKLISEKKLQHQRELEYQKEIAEQYNRVQEKERREIAKLLHDEIGNKLNILSLWIDNKETWRSEKSREVITTLIPELIEASRNISHELYPVSLEHLGLILTLEELVSNIGSVIDVQFFVLHPYEKNNTTMEIQLFRVIQEFITNIIKHAQATQMKLYIRDTAMSLNIILSDNGIGFDIRTISKGMGIRNIESRLKSNGAYWKWKSGVDKGTRLIIVVLK